MFLAGVLPPKSCDITPFFLWGCVKSKVYANNRASIQALKQNNKRLIRQLPLEILKTKFIEYCIHWMDHLRHSRGHNFIDIINNKLNISFKILIFYVFPFFFFLVFFLWKIREPQNGLPNVKFQQDLLFMFLILYKTLTNLAYISIAKKKKGQFKKSFLK